MTLLTALLDFLGALADAFGFGWRRGGLQLESTLGHVRRHNRQLGRRQEV